MQDLDLAIRPTVAADGAAIWQLVRASGVLDLNSAYCYLLLCRHFSQTCAVADLRGVVVGFVTGYLPPGRSDTFFIWQIGTRAEQRGQGIATRLVQDVLQREPCREVTFIEATVSPSNHASRALFNGLARTLQTDLAEEACFEAALFPGADHEPEDLLRIGPFEGFPTERDCHRGSISNAYF